MYRYLNWNYVPEKLARFGRDGYQGKYSMLRCLQCEFENPSRNNFCQNCGVSLTHKVCARCQKQIPLEAEICSWCGTANYKVLWGIISQGKTEEPTKSQSELVKTRSDRSSCLGDRASLEIESLTDLLAESQAPTNETSPDRADEAQLSHRYKFDRSDSQWQLDAEDHRSTDRKLLRGKVIDCYPWRGSYLTTLQQQQIEAFAKLDRDLNDSYLSVSEYWNLVGLPIHALPYLLLEKYAPTVPKIYDAWVKKGGGVVLLPDRSRWELITQFWSRQNPPLSQVVWFLDEMVKLWQPLQQISCASSLAIAENLRIDEDESFCMQQLYIDDGEPPTLQDLARTWQSCFAQSNLSNSDSLEELLDRLISGEIIEIEHLRQELQDLSTAELEIESSDLYPNFPTMNIFPSDPEITESEFDSEISESEFFDELDESMMYTSEFEDQATVTIPLKVKSITDASCTDIGTQRDHNEDFFGVRTRIEKVANNTDDFLSVRGLYIVCDGMGGHAAGEVASAMAVENLQTYFQTHWHSTLPDSNTIEAGILSANKALYETNVNNSRSGSGRMGTTLVMALLQETQLAIAHVGDSRIYRLSRQQGLEQLTQDHEVGQREINRGVEPEIAYGRPDAYQLTQALGPRDNNYVRPEIQFIEVTDDCLILLCSDGLSDNHFIEQNWSEHLEPLISSSADLHEGLFNLIDLANEHNGHDNITAVLLRIKLKPDLQGL